MKPEISFAKGQSSYDEDRVVLSVEQPYMHVAVLAAWAASQGRDREMRLMDALVKYVTSAENSVIFLPGDFVVAIRHPFICTGVGEFLSLADGSVTRLNPLMRPIGLSTLKQIRHPEFGLLRPISFDGYLSSVRCIRIESGEAILVPYLKLTEQLCS